MIGVHNLGQITGSSFSLGGHELGASEVGRELDELLTSQHREGR